MTERISANGRTRRKFLTTTGVAGALALAGCVGGDDDGGDDGSSDDSSGDDGSSDDGSSDDGGSTSEETETVSFLLNPAEANVEITVQYQPLIEYIESEVSVDVEATRTASYAATLTSLESGDGQIADTSPSAAVAAESFADIVGLRKAFGSEQYFSLITTTPDSGIGELAGVEGEEMAFGSTLSVSGGLTPLLMLKNAGLDIGNAPSGPAEDFTARFTGDHFTSLNALLEDPPIVAAGTGAFVSAPHVPQEQFDEMSQDFVDISAEYEGAGEKADEQQLDLLSVSDPLPRAPIMSRSGWESPNRSDVENAMLNAPDDAFQHDEDELAEMLDVDPDTEEGQEAIDAHAIWFTDIVDATIDDFEPIQTLLDELGLEFQDIS